MNEQTKEIRTAGEVTLSPLILLSSTLPRILNLEKNEGDLKLSSGRSSPMR